MKNLPHPPVHVSYGHSVISLRDLVTDFLGHGLPFHMYSPSMFRGKGACYNSLNGSPICVEEYCKSVAWKTPKTIFLPFVAWTDDFLTRNGMKGPHQSTHMGTISFPIPDAYSDSSDCTYPISIGRKGADHSIVFSFLFDEMKEMKQRQKDTWYYSKYLKEMVCVELCLIASLQDQLG